MTTHSYLREAVALTDGLAHLLDRLKVCLDNSVPDAERMEMAPHFLAIGEAFEHVGQVLLSIDRRQLN